MNDSAIMDIDEGTSHPNGDEVISDIAAMTAEETFKLRSYQEEMLEESMKRNSIIVLDTGAGKTHIAIARIRAELELYDTDKLVWFLAPTVALCQQHNETLQLHLPAYQIRVLLGEDDVDRWTSQAIWDAALKNVRIVISSYGVLNDALTHGFITMSRLALCVFDEAHHCKLKHPANLIMQNFYFPVKRKDGTVPHILGLSASPVMNAKNGGLELLEANLDSHAVTPKLRRLELMQYVHVPELLKYTYWESTMDGADTQSSIYLAFQEVLSRYDFKKDPYILDLISSNDPAATSKLTSVFMKGKTYCFDQLKRMSLNMHVILRDVGPEALSWYFRACLERLNTGIERGNASWMLDLPVKEKIHLKDIMSEVLKGQDLITQPDLQPAAKTQLLLETLANEAGPSFTGIIFAEQRCVVATLAVAISTHPLTSGLFNIGTFVGSSLSSKRKGDIGDIVNSRDQQQNLDDFRIGRLNLIIATSVLEEGIDVSSCQTVICFDASKNLISFVQRRGRARKEGSKHIVLLEAHDKQGHSSKWQELEKKMKAVYSSDQRNAELALQLEQQPDFNERQYLVPSTGALLTLSNAKSHLYHFCAKLLTGSQLELKPVFACHEDPDGLISAEAILPAAVHASLRRAKSSRSFKTERAAIADTAFETYKMLHENGLVNDNLLTSRTKLHDVAGDMTSRPSLIEVLPRLDPWSLDLCYPLVWNRSLVELEIDGVRQGCLRMVLPVLLPHIMNISLHWNALERANVRIRREHDVNGDDIDQLRHSTSVLLSIVYPASRFDHSKQDLLALFQPYDFETSPDLLSAREVVVGKTIDPLDFGLLRVMGQIGRAFVYDHEAAPSRQSSANTELKILARKFPKKRDFVHKPDAIASMKDSSLVELSLDECTMDKLPARYAFTAACIPSILHSIENTVLAQHLQRTLLEPISIDNIDLIIEATTSSAANYQTNYERLEYLGDTILKYLTHVQLMAQYPTWPEGYLTREKGRTNGNASLCNAALRTGVYRYVATKPFTAHRWQPRYLSEIPSNTDKKEQRSTKTLADVVEALIGASFCNKGLSGALKCIRIFLPDEQWSNLSLAHASLKQHALPLTPNSPPPSPPKHLALLEQVLGYAFQTPTLLLEATTHASYQSSSNDATSSYERLEFLGDAVLDQIVVPALHAHASRLKNHEMHRLRQALANAHFLGFLCLELCAEQARNEIVRVASDENDFEVVPSTHEIHLHDFLRCNYTVTMQRASAVALHRTLRAKILEALGHGDVYPWPALFTLHPPKLFCDLFEAVLGAIYIDSGGDLEVCGAFLERTGLLGYMRRFLEEGVKVGDPREAVGVLAGQERVKYLKGCNKQAGGDGGDGEDDDDDGAGSDGTGVGGYSCTVIVGERQVVTVTGCALEQEAEVKGAAAAAEILTRERAKSSGGGLKRTPDIAIEVDGDGDGVGEDETIGDRGHEERLDGDRMDGNEVDGDETDEP